LLRELGVRFKLGRVVAVERLGVRMCTQTTILAWKYSLEGKRNLMSWVY
jgi:hypothetical protein